MTKILLVGRDGKDLHFLSATLSRFEFLDLSICAETGATARRKKLKRMVRQRGLPGAVTLLAQIPLLVAFDALQRKKMYRTTNVQGATVTPDITIADVNEKHFSDYVAALDPDMIYCFGTSVFQTETLDRIPLPIINFHTGVLPGYRNVHTDFWAYVHEDWDGLGVSAFVVSPGIDEGPVIKMRRNAEGQHGYLWDVKRRNLELVAEMMVEFAEHPPELTLDQTMRNAAVNMPACGRPTFLWPTPSTVPLIKYAWSETRQFVRTSVHLKRVLPRQHNKNR